MPEALAGRAAFEACTAMVEAFSARGLAGVCISPGSRSTPVVLAFVRSGLVPVRVVLDERSAAFSALGLAKATGRPAACVCTSGTAAANYYPAVVEAFMSSVPLVVLTADRPPWARGTGANQTIDQRELYGRYVRAFFDLWAWEPDAVMDAAAGPPPGPVQVNLPFDEPLVP